VEAHQQQEVPQARQDQQLLLRRDHHCKVVQVVAAIQ
jgi:hypothetical protein